MLYIDTSVLVALCTDETKSIDVNKWCAQCTQDLVSAAWCVTEFGSGMGLKQRTGQLTNEQEHTAWVQFERVCANDLQLLPIEPATFHKAAMLTMDGASGLCAGDALHLTCALVAKAKGIATLDVLLAKNAKLFKFKPAMI